MRRYTDDRSIEQKRIGLHIVDEVASSRLEAFLAGVQSKALESTLPLVLLHTFEQLPFECFYELLTLIVLQASHALANNRLDVPRVKVIVREILKQDLDKDEKMLLSG